VLAGAHQRRQIRQRREVRGDDPQVLLHGQDRPRLGGDRRRDDRLDEGRGQCAGGLQIDRPVETNDAAKRRQRISLTSAHIGVGYRRSAGDAARIRVLNHNRGRLAEFKRDPRGGVEVEQVRERQLLALMHGRGAEAGRTVGVPRAALVRVFAVAQIANLRQPR